MNVIEKPLRELRPYPNNPRQNDAAVEYVANSLRAFGWKQPIVIDKDGVIIAGHTRWKAAQTLGWKTAPCVIADDLSEEQIKAYRLADNKTAEMAEWDFDALEAELDGIEMDMEQFGFEDEDAETVEAVGGAETDPTAALPESRVFVFAISTFGTSDECFIEAKLTQEEADHLIERAKEAPVEDICEKVRGAIRDL